jgi:hypothetical protein
MTPRLTPDNIADYAETLMRQVRAGGGPVLDYSPASVATLESLLRASDDRMAGANEAQVGLVVFYNGCFLGELLARTLGGVWQFDPDNWFESSVVFPFPDGGIQVHPFHKLHRRVTEGAAENDLVAYYDGLRQRLKGIAATDSAP